MKDFWKEDFAWKIAGFFGILLFVLVIGAKLGIPILKEPLDGLRSWIRGEPNAHQLFMVDYYLSYRELQASVGDNASDKELLTALRSHHSRISAISFKGCSPEFRNDFVAVINSTAQVINELERSVAYDKSLPDGFVGGFFMGAFNALAKGEIDGGATRIMNEKDRLDQRVQVALEEVGKALAVMKKYE